MIRKFWSMMGFEDFEEEQEMQGDEENMDEESYIIRSDGLVFSKNAYEDFMIRPIKNHVMMIEKK